MLKRANRARRAHMLPRGSASLAAAASSFIPSIRRDMSPSAVASSRMGVATGAPSSTATSSRAAVSGAPSPRKIAPVVSRTLATRKLFCGVPSGVPCGVDSGVVPGVDSAEVAGVVAEMLALGMCAAPSSPGEPGVTRALARAAPEARELGSWRALVPAAAAANSARGALGRGGGGAEGLAVLLVAVSRSLAAGGLAAGSLAAGGSVRASPTGCICRAWDGKLSIETRSAEVRSASGSAAFALHSRGVD